jgi:hypothetical protein
VTYEIFNPPKHTRPATDDTDEHVPENGGTWHFDIFASVWAKASVDVEDMKCSQDLQLEIFPSCCFDSKIE